MRLLPTYAGLGWAGHLFAAVSVYRHGWDGFILAVCVDLPFQCLLLRWAYREWQARRRRAPILWSATLTADHDGWQIDIPWGRQGPVRQLYARKALPSRRRLK